VRLSPTPARLLSGLERQPVSAPAPQASPPAPEAVVQVGSFRDEENAGYLVRDLKTKGFAAQVTEAVIHGARYYRVVIGSVHNAEQAQALLVRLKEAGFEGVLLLPD
jgi:cell division protein FtsN